MSGLPEGGKSRAGKASVEKRQWIKKRKRCELEEKGRDCIRREEQLVGKTANSLYDKLHTNINITHVRKRARKKFGLDPSSWLKREEKSFAKSLHLALSFVTA